MKKWIDYLFEPEPVKTDKPEQKPEEPKPAAAPEKKPEVKAEQPEPKPEETKTEQAQTTRKHSGSFINLEELQVKKNDKQEEKPRIEADPKPYENHPTISPIFGYLDGEKPKDFVLHTPQIKTDTGSLLGTIYSPYYGVMKQDYRSNGKHSAAPKEEIPEPERHIEEPVRAEERPVPAVTERVVPETVWETIPLSPMHLNGYEAPEEEEPAVEEVPVAAEPEHKDTREEIEQISISEEPLSMEKIEELEPDDLDRTFDHLELELGDLGDDLFSDLLDKPEEKKEGEVKEDFVNHPIEEILDNRPQEKEEEISLFDELFKLDKEKKA